MTALLWRRRENVRVPHLVALRVPRLDVSVLHWLASTPWERMILNSHIRHASVWPFDGRSFARLRRVRTHRSTCGLNSVGDLAWRELPTIARTAGLSRPFRIRRVLTGPRLKRLRPFVDREPSRSKEGNGPHNLPDDRNCFFARSHSCKSERRTERA